MLDTLFLSVFRVNISFVFCLFLIFISMVICIWLKNSIFALLLSKCSIIPRSSTSLSQTGLRLTIEPEQVTIAHASSKSEAQSWPKIWNCWWNTLCLDFWCEMGFQIPLNFGRAESVTTSVLEMVAGATVSIRAYHLPVFSMLPFSQYLSCSALGFFFFKLKSSE